MFSMAFDDLGSLCPEELVALFNSKCTGILDSIALNRNKSSKAPSGSWINMDIRALRHSCRHAERRWKKDKLHIFFGIMRDDLLEYQNAVKAAKADYLSNRVSNNIDRPKVFFSMFWTQTHAPLIPLYHHLLFVMIFWTSLSPKSLLCGQYRLLLFLSPLAPNVPCSL